jgi:iron complex outermembrane receptor protein
MRVQLWLVGLCFVSMVLPARAETEVKSTPSDLQGDFPGSLGGDRPAATVTEWMAQIEAAQVQITNVRLETTETGLQVILETATGKLTVPKPRTVDNRLIAEIENAEIGQAFSQAEPIPGIAQVNVTNLPNAGVRVEIVGTNATPVAEVTATEAGAVWVVTPGTAEVAEEDEVEITVTAEKEEETGYRVPNTSVGTRTDTPLRDIPQSIQVVPSQVIEDRNPDTVIEATETVSGVVYDGGFADAPTGSVIIRGFSQPQQFRNGFRDTDRTGLTALGTVEQIDVLKGPASVLFGAVEPGGIINVVTRQPLSDSAYNLNFEVGNRNLYQPR